MSPARSMLSHARTLGIVCLMTVALAGACTPASTGSDSRSCKRSSDCPAQQACVDGTCEPFEVGQDAGTPVTDAAPAADAMTCPPPQQCDYQCCEAGQMCHQGKCVAQCEDPAKLCGEDQQQCCAGGEACLSDSCVPLGAECERTHDCPVGSLCEPTLGRCVPRDQVRVCQHRPETGEFSPQQGCRWTPPEDGEFSTSGSVEMTPAVANLTDDNGDGETNTLDIPDIVFVSYDKNANGCCTPQGVVRVVSGRCNDDGTMDTIATLGRGNPWIGASSGVALGNLHPSSEGSERVPEIVATFQRGGTVAWTRTAADGSEWEIYWRNDEYLTNQHRQAAAQPHIADVHDSEGPEVILGNVVLDGQTGELLWDGRQTVGPEAGIGHNAFLGPNSTTADLDLDGTIEVIAGNTVYEGTTGAEEWSYEFGDNPPSGCQGGKECDGLSAVANFDDDEEGEVVLVRQGEVFVLEHDGTLKHQIPIPWDDCTKDNGQPGNEGGPPTVADFDGDDNPEIAAASADFYVVFDLECTGSPLPEQCESEYVLWKVPNRDCSSRVTGSSVFDFEGDGRAEVVYADQSHFRIFDGRTGQVLLEDETHSSNTRMEMPIVVDVDNDGQSEVVVPEPNRSEDAGGIDIWEDADNNWVRTRRIWNQHSYHVTNVSEDGQIPSDESENWRNGRLNNFRQNVQPSGVFDAPNLTVKSIRRPECAGEGRARIAVEVSNRGALGVPEGLAVYLTAEEGDGTRHEIGVRRTTMRLLPGMSETIVFEWMPPGGWHSSTFTLTATADQDAMGQEEFNECVEDDNSLTSEPLDSCTLE